MIMSEMLLPQQFPARKLAGIAKVLLVDDDADTTELMRMILDPGSFEVTTTDASHNVVELVQMTQPDVLVIDLMIGMEGLELIKQVRAISDVPLLVLSAINKPGIVAQALDEGADDYLSKPMKSSVLIAYLNKLARRRRAEQEAFQGNGKYRL